METGGAEGGRAVLRELPLAGRSLRNADLRYANLEGADLRNGDLSGADLQWANIKGANLEGCSFAYAKAINADLTGAQMQHACLDEACFIDAQLSGANLQHAQARKASFLGASLLRADLRWADLEGAYLTTADVRFAQLGGASLRHAQLRNAHLRGTELDGADLAGADLRGAQHVASSRLRQARHWRKAQRDGSVLRRLGEAIAGPIILAGAALWSGPRRVVAGVGAGLAWIGRSLARGARGLARGAVAVVKAPVLAAIWLGSRTAAAARVVARGLARGVVAVVKAPVLGAIWLGSRTAAAARLVARGLARGVVAVVKAPVLGAIWLGSRTAAAARLVSPVLARAVVAVVKAPVLAAIWLGSRTGAAAKLLARTLAHPAAVAATAPVLAAKWLGAWAGVAAMLLLRTLARAFMAAAKAAAVLCPWVGRGAVALLRGLGRGLLRGCDRLWARRSHAVRAALAMRRPSRALAQTRADRDAGVPVWQRISPAARPRMRKLLWAACGATAAWATAAWAPRRPATLASVGAGLAMAASVAVLSLGESPSETRAQSAAAAPGTERLMPRTAALQAPQPGAAEIGARDDVASSVLPAPEDRPQAEAGDGQQARSVQHEFVTLKNSNVRAGPSVRTKRVGYLPQGTRVDVTGRVVRKQWYRVILPDEQIGYIYMPLLKQVSDASGQMTQARARPVLRPVTGRDAR